MGDGSDHSKGTARPTRDFECRCCRTRQARYSRFKTTGIRSRIGSGRARLGDVAARHLRTAHALGISAWNLSSALSHSQGGMLVHS